MLCQCYKYVECTQFYCLNGLNWLCKLIFCHWILPLEHKHKCWSGWFAYNAPPPPSEDNAPLFALSLWSICVYSLWPDWHFAFSPLLSVLSQTVSCLLSVYPSGSLLWWYSSHVSLIKDSKTPPSSTQFLFWPLINQKDRQLWKDYLCRRTGSKLSQHDTPAPT